MSQIVETRVLAPEVKLFRIRAPRIAAKRKAGQFVILRVAENGERIPITIAGSDTSDGTITIIVQSVGKTTRMLHLLEAGDHLHDLVGPLGQPSHIANFGTAVVIGGGLGTAIALPTAVALKDAGNHVISIIGGRTRELVILEDQLRTASDEMYPTTDDGSYGFHGFVTQKLQELIDGGRRIDYVLAIGPIPMMASVAEVTRPHGIHTVVSLNPVMVDGTGMCGGCRATVDGKIVFVCVDGPEFDAHKVDFKSLALRNRQYRQFESESMDLFHRCNYDVAFEQGLKEQQAQKPQESEHARVE